MLKEGGRIQSPDDCDARTMKKAGYTWGGNPCVRHGEDFKEEAHPCYYCGTLIPINTKACSHCYFMPCPSCGICWCNAGPRTREALRTLRNKYCCTQEFFKEGIKEGDLTAEMLLPLVPYFKDSLDFCRRLKGYE